MVENYVYTSRLIQTNRKKLFTGKDTICNSKILKLIWMWQSTRGSWQNEFYLSYIVRFFEWCLALNETAVQIRNDSPPERIFSFYTEHFPIPLDSKIVIWTQYCSKYVILRPFPCWYGRLSLRELDQKV